LQVSGVISEFSLQSQLRLVGAWSVIVWHQMMCDPGSCLTFQFRLVLYGAGTRFR